MGNCTAVHAMHLVLIMALYVLHQTVQRLAEAMPLC